MTEQPSSNISLTFEQMAQVEETKKRLSNLENEITIATKNLNVLNKETLKATKEREYQEELISGLSGNIEKLQADKISLENSIIEMEYFIKNSQEEVQKANKEISDKKEDLRLKEIVISASEDRIKKDLAEIDKKASEILEDRKVLETAYNAFNEALKTIVWK